SSSPFEEGYDSFYNPVQRLCGHHRMKWQRDDLMAHAICDGQIASTTFFKKREPVSGLPVYSCVYAALAQMSAQLITLIARHANVVEERRDVHKICLGNYDFGHASQILVVVAVGRTPTL